MRYNVYFLVLTTFLSVYSLRANNAFFIHLSKNNGLSNNDVKTIFKDSKGYIWFGTEDGLNKFDGYKFTIYKSDAGNEKSISGNYVSSIVEDKNSNLWIGTDAGLNKYIRETEEFIRFDTINKFTSKNTNYRIGSMLLDHKGYLWIAYDYWLRQFNTNTNITENLIQNSAFKKRLQGSTASCIFEDSRKNLYIGLWYGGLYKLNKDRNIVSLFPNNSINTNNPFDYTVSNIYEENTEQLWIGTYNSGLYKITNINPNLQRVQNPLLPSEIYSIVPVGNNKLWLCQNHSVVVINKLTEQIEKKYYNIPGNLQSFTPGRVACVYKDNTNIIWFGTGVGISYTDPNRDKFSAFYKQIGSDTDNEKYYTTSFIFDQQNNAWIGTFGKGIFYYNTSNGTYTQFTESKTGLLSDYINCIAPLSTGMLWIGTLQGISIFNPYTKKVVKQLQHNANNFNSLYHNCVQKIYEDSKLNVWIITQESLDLIEGQRYIHFTKYDLQGLSHYKINDVLEDSNGEIWIATTNGLNKYNRQQKTVKQFFYNAQNPGSISSSDISAILEDSHANLWFGTRNGLNRYNAKTKLFTLHQLNEGLHNDVIYKIIEDNNKNLWLITATGITKFNVQTGTIKNYDESDGLNINKQCFYKNNNGEIAIGGQHTGFYIFNPDSINNNNINPAIYITKLLLFNKPIAVEPNNKNAILQKDISISTNINLKYDQSVIAFEFTALNYTLPEKNRFAYKLEGFDKHWSYVGADKRFITYTNLDPGKYTLLVKGSNNDGVWNQKGTSLQINILPPFWRTNIAYLIYFILFTVLLFLFRYILLARYKLKANIEIERVQAEKTHEIDQLKLDFFANISHEFRTPLTLILGTIDYFNDQQEALSWTKDKEYFVLMKRNADRLLHLINKVLDIKKLDSGLMKVYVKNSDIIQFIKSLSASFNFRAERKNIEYKINSNFNTYNAWFDADAVDKIIFNLLSNAFKFTPDNGKIEIEITILQAETEAWQKTKDDNEFTFTGDLIKVAVIDTGIGIPKEQKEKIFNRFYQADNYAGRSGGSGIGLALVKELVELIGGKITLYSQIDTGSCFTVILPIGNDLIKNNTNIEIDKNPVSIEHTELTVNEYLPKSKTDWLVEKPIILVVEDNQDMEMYISNILKSKYDIICANNGKTGLELAIENIPDLIISDIMMPELDGLEMSKILRTDERTNHIPIILLTARSSEEYQLEGLETGVDDYITKPFNAKILKLKADNIILNRQILREKYMLNNPEQAYIPNANNNIDQLFIEKARTIVEKHLDNSDFDPQTFANEIGMSRVQLYRKLKAVTNKTVSDFVIEVRIHAAANILTTQNKNISEVAFEVGFKFPTHFSRIFSKYYGMSPTQYVEHKKNRA